MSIQEVDKMSNKGSWIPISADNDESLEDGDEDNVTNGEYYIQLYYGNINKKVKNVQKSSIILCSLKFL